MRVPTVIQFGDKDEVEFRPALLKGGMTRADAASECIDATAAEATLGSDREMILAWRWFTSPVWLASCSASLAPSEAA